MPAETPPPEIDQSAGTDELAARLYLEAATLREAGDLVGACAKLYGAVALAARASGLLELGGCFEREGDRTTALALLERARDASGEEPADAALQARIEHAIASIRESTTELIVNAAAVEEGAWVVYTIDGHELESSRVGGSLRLPAGKHVVDAERPGCARWHGEVECRAAVRCEVEVPALGCAGELVATSETLRPHRMMHKGAFARQGFADNPYARGGIWLGGAGAVIIVVGIVELRKSGSDLDRARSLGCNSRGDCPNGTGDELFADSQRKQRYAIASFVVGGLASIAAVSLVLYGRSQGQARPRKPAISVAPLWADDAGAVVSVGGVF